MQEPMPLTQHLAFVARIEDPGTVRVYTDRLKEAGEGNHAKLIELAITLAPDDDDQRRHLRYDCREALDPSCVGMGQEVHEVSGGWLVQKPYELMSDWGELHNTSEQPVSFRQYTTCTLRWGKSPKIEWPHGTKHAARRERARGIIAHLMMPFAYVVQNYARSLIEWDWGTKEGCGMTLDLVLIPALCNYVRRSAETRRTLMNDLTSPR
jgi:hypothetical protein